MSFIKNCQMSIFGNYESIVPESDLVRNLADALKEYEFIPGTIDVGLFDSVRGEASIGKRIHMISENECWKINILMERIDFLYTYKESGKEYFRLEDVCDTRRFRSVRLRKLRAGHIPRRAKRAEAPFAAATPEATPKPWRRSCSAYRRNSFAVADNSAAWKQTSYAIRCRAAPVPRALFLPLQALFLRLRAPAPLRA